MRIFVLLLLAGLWFGIGQPTPAHQPPVILSVMSSGGFTAAYKALSPTFTETTKIGLRTVYGASMGGAPSSIPSRLTRGETADVVILAAEGLDRLLAEGYIVADSRVDLASSQIGMVMTPGTTPPDISTVDRFILTLMEAKSIAYSASASGTYLSTVLFQRLQIADALATKSIRVVGERVGTVVARGDAELGFQQISELLPIPGVTYVGAIPNDLQKITVFSAAITTQSQYRRAAQSLIDFLASANVAPVITETGMLPHTRSSSP